MLSLLAALAIVTAPQQAPEAAGPWRQLIRFQPSADNAEGVSLWILAADMAPAGAARSNDMRTAHELWVIDGPAAGDQAYSLRTNVLDCDQGGYQMRSVSAFRRDGTLLGTATGGGEYLPSIPHSAEALVWNVVCTDRPAARLGEAAETVADAVAQTGVSPSPAPAASQLQIDVDHDGLPDSVRVSMRPHSMRHDVEIVRAAEANRTINIVTAEQPASGPLVQRHIRPSRRARYVTACEMTEGRDVEPCSPAWVLAQQGVEVVGDRGPSILVWLQAGQPRVARLPSVD